MSFAAYLKSHAGEILLVLLTAWAVSCVAMNGFFLDSIVEQYGYAFRAGIALAADAVLVFVLYAAAFNPKARARGAVMFVAVAAVVVIASFALSGGENPYEDAEGNYVSLALDLVVVCLACFGLTRTTVGCMGWFVVASAVCSMAQAFWGADELAMSVVAVAASLALIVYRNFKGGVASAAVAKKGAGALAFGTSAVVAIAAAAVALGAWFAIIAPLGPPTLDVKLFTEYRQLPIEEYQGTASEHPQLNYDMTSKDTVDGDPFTTDDLREDATSDVTVDAASAMQQQALANAAGSGTGSSAGGGSKQDFSSDSSEQVYSPISYDTQFPWVTVWIAAVLAGIALLAAYFLIRRRLRMVRLRRMLGQGTPTSQVIELYRLLLGKLGRLGFACPDGMSLSQFAASSERAMETLTEETRVPFTELTRIYVAADYGQVAPSEDEVTLFAAYYLRFWKAARAQLGNLKYFFRSFRL